MNNGAFEAAKTRALQKLEPGPGVLRSATQAATLAQMRQIATRANMNAILAAPNVAGDAPFQKQAAQKIKDEMNLATGGRRSRRNTRSRRSRRNTRT